MRDGGKLQVKGLITRMLVNHVWMDRFWTETVHKYTAEMRPNFVWIQFEHLLDVIWTYFRFGPRDCTKGLDQGLGHGHILDPIWTLVDRPSPP